MMDGLVEIVGWGVFKGLVLKQVCDDLGIDLVDVVVFGDMLNDFMMLEMVGYFYIVLGVYLVLCDCGFVIIGNYDELVVGWKVWVLLD